MILLLGLSAMLGASARTSASDTSTTLSRTPRPKHPDADARSFAPLRPFSPLPSPSLVCAHETNEADTYTMMLFSPDMGHLFVSFAVKISLWFLAHLLFLYVCACYYFLGGGLEALLESRVGAATNNRD